MNLLQAYEVVDSHFLVVKESNGMTALVIDTKVLNISYNESWGAIELVIGEEE